MRLPGYACKRTAVGASTSRDAANILIRAKRLWTRADHARLAALHLQAAEMQQAAYNQAINEAAQETLGRPWQVWDYQVSCIGRDEFSEAWKQVLRYHGHAASKHRVLAAAHQAASTSRRIH